MLENKFPKGSPPISVTIQNPTDIEQICHLLFTDFRIYENHGNEEGVIVTGSILDDKDSTYQDVLSLISNCGYLVSQIMYTRPAFVPSWVDVDVVCKDGIIQKRVELARSPWAIFGISGEYYGEVDYRIDTNSGLRCNVAPNQSGTFLFFPKQEKKTLMEKYLPLLRNK